MYYGNRAVSTTSSFDGTLIFGDPFDNSSLDTSRWTSVDGVTAYNMNPTEHYLEVTDMAPNQGTGVGFHSRNISMPSYWIIQDAYSDQGFVIYHESEASSDMFGQLVSLQNLTNVGSHGGAAYVMVHDGWVGDADVSDSAIVGSDSWDSGYWLPPMPYTTRWTMKRDLDGVITLSQNGIDRIARASNDTTDRMTWELERYENPGAGFGTERLYAFMVRKYVSPEPLQGIWGGEERKTWIVDDDGPADFSTIQEAINAANDEDTVFVRNGTYYEHVMVNKTLILSGEDRNATIIDGEYKDPPEMQGSIVVVVTDNVRINGFTLQHCRSGGNAIRLEGYVNMTFSGNIITGCNEGVRILHSSGNFVSGNIVQDCYYNTGIGLDWSFNNTVQGNTIIRNHYGLSGGYDNHDNTYSENIVINNDIGFGTNAYDDRFFHNNFVNNGVHVSASGVNQFDDGYPSGGNYWSDYNGTDFCYGTYQNETGSDNVGDSPYVVDANNVDNYPLMQPHVPFENQTIYIRADGSIDPSGAPILRKGDLYTLTSNITCNADGIVVEKDNIVVDGSGFAFEGIGSSFGVYLYGRSNVTIKNININNFYRGIYLYSSSDNSIDGNSITANEDGIWLHEYSQYNRINGNSISGCGEGIMLYFSSDNIIVGNNVTNNRDGIWLYSASNSNVVSGNTLADNGYGIRLSFSSNNSMSGNSITKNVGIGVVLTDSSNNSIGGNNLTDNYIGVGLTRSFNNTVCHNSFLNNTVQVYDWTPENVNVWDNGCEGNFWSDYNGTDLDNDGVGDTYLPWEAVDNFPLMNVYWNPCDINHDLKVDMKDIGRSAKAFNTVPGDLLWNPHADITGPFGQPDGKIDMRDIALIARHFMETYS
jgi:parallel beta-helix repeat protein